MQNLIFDITMVIGPDTESEREIVYDDNNGKGFTQDEAFDRLDELKSLFSRYWPGTTRFSVLQRDAPASSEPVARQKRPAVDWSRMRPLLPSKQPPAAQQGGLLEVDEEDERDDWSM